MSTRNDLGARYARAFSILLFASVAAAGLNGCRAEPAEPRSAVLQTDLANRPEPSSREPTQLRQKSAEAIDFASDLYLKDVCRGDLIELPFKRFKSYDFIYNSPLPVKVSGAYYEIRSKDSADAATVYEEIVATIFRDVEMVVEADQTAPDFSFDRWDVPFAVSDYPFSAHHQLQHQRAMGSMFPFLDLSGIGRSDGSGSDFSRNFISTLNFLATRGATVGGETSSEEREKADQIREAITATDYERPLPISDEVIAALRRIPPGVKPTVHGRGSYILISLGKPARVVAAIDTSKDAVGLRACNGES